MGMLRDYFINHYPRTDFHELNQDWMIRTLFDMIDQVENFVSQNAVKYADPIDWEITSSYEKNTIVIDPVHGVAYISAHAVPRGISLSNTHYWNVIFDLSRFITLASQNFANSYEATYTSTATIPTDESKWVVWNSLLYRAKNDIHVGDAYVVDGNIERYTVEMFFDELATLIANETQARIDGDTALHGEIVDESVARENADNTLQDNIDAVSSDVDAEILARENADDVLQDNIDAESQARSDADDALQDNIDAESQARSDADDALHDEITEVIDRVISVNVLSLGVKNDGSTDVSAILNTYISTHNNLSLYFPNGQYLFNNTINLTDKKIDIIGQSEFNTIFIYNNSGSLFSDRHNGDPLVEHNHKTFTNFTCKVPNGTCFDMYCVAQRVFKNIYFDDCLNGFHIEGSDGIYINNILQNGSLYNEWAFGGQIGNYWLFNWDTVIDGWVTESNDNPRTAKPWFTLSGMVCSYINNITTHGRLETIAFDIVGHNEGTFFTNVILVCPTWGITCHPDANNNLPACVECNNFSIDQPFQGGVFFDGQWFMLDNFSIVNGNQRGNTDAAIVLGEDITEVWISNGIIYNWNGSAINMDRSTHVSFTGVVIRDMTDAGSGAYAYINTSQTVNNPKITNCDFDGAIVIPAGLTFNNTSTQISAT